MSEWHQFRWSEFMIIILSYVSATNDHVLKCIVVQIGFVHDSKLTREWAKTYPHLPVSIAPAFDTCVVPRGHVIWLRTAHQHTAAAWTCRYIGDYQWYKKRVAVGVTRVTVSLNTFTLNSAACRYRKYMAGLCCIIIISTPFGYVVRNSVRNLITAVWSSHLSYMAI